MSLHFSLPMPRLSPQDATSPSACAEPPTITLSEYLAEQAGLETLARTQYPGRLDQCTYVHGYLRQRLYICHTCPHSTMPPSESSSTTTVAPAAICYACSVMCHSKCDLEELYVKRHFRCDCGNSHFAANAGLSSAREKAGCTLCSMKDYENEENDYGLAAHNFRGKYCACNEEYDGERDMFQCLICEDWWHAECLGEGAQGDSQERPLADSFEEMICWRCVDKYPFLSEYIAEGRRCLREVGERSILHRPHATICLKDGWRDFICKCSACITALDLRKLSFIHAGDPPVYEPEADPAELELEPAHTPIAHMTKLLDSMDRTMLANGLEKLKHVRQRLSAFLAPFAAEDRVVTEQDIKEFVRTNFN